MIYIIIILLLTLSLCIFSSKNIEGMDNCDTAPIKGLHKLN